MSPLSSSYAGRLADGANRHIVRNEELDGAIFGELLDLEPMSLSAV